MPTNELGSNPREVMKQRLIELLREPLLAAIDREFRRMIAEQNIVLTRSEYLAMKWEVVRAIVSRGE
jgi:hypothetical protein